jgi:site-specific recombinase XerD
MTTLALPVIRFGPIMRDYERAVKDKSYRRTPIGQEAARYLRTLKWGEHRDSTLLSYESTYSRLALDHDDYEGLAGFCTPVGVEYLREFLSRHWGEAKATTKRQRTSAIRSLFAWAVDEQLIPWNPAAALKLPRARGGEERVSYPMRVLWQLVSAQKTMREQCALQLLCRMGLRKDELRQLRVGEIDLARNLLAVHGKGGKDAVLPLDFPSLNRDLYLHVQERHVDEYLLYPRSHKRRPLDSSSLHRWFKRCLEIAGLPSTILMHELRHSAADHLWRDSGNLVLAQELLRHESVSTTQGYLHPTRRDLTLAMRHLDEAWGR